MAEAKSTGVNSRIKRDLCGQRFGKVVAIAPIEGERGKHGNALWRCLCDCGTECITSRSSLKCGGTTSCGCLRRPPGQEKPKRRCKGDELYDIWCGMKRRCNNPAAQNYPRYGGRGIRVCDRWMRSFDAFADDMGPRPSKSHSIDRIDNDGNYEPGNCRWATWSEQNTNTRQRYSTVMIRDESGQPVRRGGTSGQRAARVLIQWNGEVKGASHWAKIAGISKMTMRHRLRAGWSMDRIMATPSRRAKSTDV